jgi:purine-nucleoside phosphorylase
MESLHDRVEQAVRAVRKHTAVEPSVGIVLGSGLGMFAREVESGVTVSYHSIPNMPVSAVPGHAGVLHVGRLGRIRVAVMAGRVHLYEGWSPEEVTFGVRLLRALGTRTIVLTNAAGGIAPDLAAGDLMAISDHLNLTGRNPLAGPNDDRLGTRFPDMTGLYDAPLRARLAECASQLGVPLKEGVYAALLGPSYETPAEIRMLRAMGADAVGMSTALEAIAARHAGLRVVALSCITNLAAGISPRPLSHDEVQETADRVRESFVKLLLEAVPKFGK